MSKYYYLIAGLPALSLDDTKLTYSVAEFKTELDPVLSDADKELLRWYFLKYDQVNLLSYLRKTVAREFDERGIFSEEDIQEICHLLETEDKVPENVSVPPYLVKFVRAYYARFEEAEAADYRLLEDRLSALYYDAAMHCKNTFLASWFEMNLNIGNVMAALNCYKYGLDKEEYIIGENETARQLRQSSARDFNIGSELDYMSELLQITEDPDFMMREKRLDVLRWNWLDEQVFDRTFDIESVIAYLLRLEMIERWVLLDKVQGEKTFRQLVTDMKRESSESLEEFKENNK
ncbi:DUF2764 domain-containing protein [Bacteroides sp. OttesenSCG-928-D19]|nr:DUF2764 domain-containing protein [Bacteroides sp. OttesenSCG-928-D19]